MCAIASPGTVEMERGYYGGGTHSRAELKALRQALVRDY